MIAAAAAAGIFLPDCALTSWMNRRGGNTGQRGDREDEGEEADASVHGPSYDPISRNLNVGG